MSIRRNDAETQKFITKVLSHYRLQLDPDGTSDLCDTRKVKSIKVLGYLNPEGEQLFHPVTADKMIPGGCKLKNTAEGIHATPQSHIALQTYPIETSEDY